MGQQGRRGSSTRPTVRGASISVSGTITLPNGNKAVRIVVSGQTVLVPPGGGTTANVSDVRSKINSVGSPASASLSPKSNGEVRVSISGPDGSTSFEGAFA